MYTILTASEQQPRGRGRDKSRTFGQHKAIKAIVILYRKGKLTNPRGLSFIGSPTIGNLNVIMDQDAVHLDF